MTTGRFRDSLPHPLDNLPTSISAVIAILELEYLCTLQFYLVSIFNLIHGNKIIEDRHDLQSIRRVIYNLISSLGELRRRSDL